MYEKKVAMLAMVVCSVVFTRMVDAEASEDIKEILTSGDYEYCILDDGTIQITNFYGSADQLEIPDEIDGKMVSEIGNRAFSSCKNLTGIKIPDSVIEIDDYAFEDSNLTTITFSCGKDDTSCVPESKTYKGKDVSIVCGECPAEQQQTL